MVNEHEPKMLMCFGGFAFEFALRAIEGGQRKPIKIKEWKTDLLGEVFLRRVNEFNSQSTNIFLLLHATIARGRFLYAHNYYCGSNFCQWGNANYFDFVGNHLSKIILSQLEKQQLWVESIWI
jgi:hypothetical protein